MKTGYYYFSYNFLPYQQDRKKEEIPEEKNNEYRTIRKFWVCMLISLINKNNWKKDNGGLKK